MMNKKDLEKTKKLVNSSLASLKTSGAVTRINKNTKACTPRHELTKNPKYPVSDELINAALEARYYNSGRSSPLYALSCGHWNKLTDADLVAAAVEFETFKKNPEIAGHAKVLRKLAKVWPNKSDESTVSNEIKLSANPWRKSIGSEERSVEIVKSVKSSKNLMKQFEYMCDRENAFKKSKVYDKDRALVLFTYLADAGSREATRSIHSMPMTKFTTLYTAETRRMAAREFLKWYEAGKYSNSLPNDSKLKSVPVSKKSTSVNKKTVVKNPANKLSIYPKYKFYVVDHDTQILAGNDRKSSALDAMKDLPSRLKSSAKLITALGYKKLSCNRDPCLPSSWSKDSCLVCKANK